MTTEMLLLTVLLIVLILAFLPAWPYSRSWGYNPSALLGIALLCFVLWVVFGSNNRTTNDIGQDIKQGVREVGDDIKDLGEDAKAGVKKMVN